MTINFEGRRYYMGGIFFIKWHALWTKNYLFQLLSAFPECSVSGDLTVQSCFQSLNVKMAEPIWTIYYGFQNQI